MPSATRDAVLAFVEECYREKSERLGEELMRELNTQVMLRVIDTRWMGYLQEMDYLKQGIGLRGYGQRDPLVEYRSEAYRAFGILVDTMYEDYLRTVLRIDVGRRTVTNTATGRSEEFPLDAYKRYCLMNGLDDIDFLLERRDLIEEFERRR